MRRQQRIVYAVRNKINDKSYIGYCVDYKERKARHLQSAKNGQAGKFYDALRKYDFKNFEWIILFDRLGTIENCRIMERRMIVLFDTYNNGYNGTEGGEGGNTFDGSNNSGIFQKGNIPWNKGMRMSKEHRKKLSDAHAGVPLSRKHAENIGKAHLGKKRPKGTGDKIAKTKYKPIKQLSMNGDIIQEFGSIKEASQILNISQSSISNVLIGRSLSGGGFKWEYNGKSISGR